MSVEAEALRIVMRQWATGVAVLTAGAGAQAHGMTVNSFTSVSLDPPLVLVCIERSVRTHPLVEHARAFAISILAADQAALSDRFAGRETDVLDRLAGLQTHTAVTGAPILEPNLGWLDCAVTAAHPGGTHTIFVAEVVAARSQAGGAPLVYFDRAYRRLKE